MAALRALPWRKLMAFGLTGGLATLVDLGVQALVHATVGGNVYAVRVVSISLAMVMAWWCNRVFTFRVKVAPTLAEFGRYAAVAWVAMAVNFAVFSAIMASGLVGQGRGRRWWRRWWRRGFRWG